MSFAHVGRDTWIGFSVSLDVAVNQRYKMNIWFLYVCARNVVINAPLQLKWKLKMRDDIKALKCINYSYGKYFVCILQH